MSIRKINLSIVLTNFIISLIFLNSILKSLIDDELILNISFTYLYVFFVNIILIFIFILLRKFLKFRSLSIIYLSIFLFLNFLALVLSNYDFFLSSNKVSKIFIFLFFIFSFFSINLFFERNIKIMGYILGSFFVIFIFQILDATIYYKKITSNYGNSNVIYTDEFKNIKFKKKNNIYLFSFDGLVPKTLAKKLLKIEDHSIYDTLDKNFFSFKNSFCENVFTKPCLNSLYFLNPVDWKIYSKNNKIKQYDFFSGRQLSPLKKILKENDFKIATGFLPGSWSVGGKYVDEFNNFGQTNKINKPLYCRWKKPFYYLEMFFICNIFEAIIPKPKDFINIRDVTANLLDVDSYYYKKAIKSIDKKSSDTHNWFFHQHIYRPGHTLDDFVMNEKNINEFSEYYKNRLSLAETFLKEILLRLKNNDPNSVLLIFGDHGSLITGPHTKIKKSIDLETQILDRHGIYLGLHSPNNICKKEIMNLKLDYSSPSIALKKILSCLSETQIEIDYSKHQFSYDKIFIKDFLFE